MTPAYGRSADREVRDGDLEAARAHLDECLRGLDEARLATGSACLVLLAFGHLSIARGAPTPAATALGAMDGLRARVGLKPWPNSRPTSSHFGS